MRGRRPWLGEAGAVLALAALALVKMWSLVTPIAGSRAYLGGDFGLAVEGYFYHQLKSGRLPLWDPTIGTGAPFLGAGTHHPMFVQAHLHLFYPINLLWLGLAERREFIAHTVLQFHHTLHYALAGAFAYAYGRQLGIGRVPAMVAGAAFMFSGFLLGHLHHWTIVDTIVWLPAVLAAILRTDATGRVRWAVATGLALGIAFLAGHPQIFYYVALAALGLGATLLGRRLEAGQPWRQLALNGVVAGLIAFGISAVQLLPTWATALESHRAGLGYDWKTFQSLHPAYLLQLLMPWGLRIVGGWREGASKFYLYPGLLTLVLAGYALARRWDWRVGFHAVLGLGALLLAFGAHYGLYRPAYDLLPGLRLFRIPARSLGLVSFALAMLAGLGADALLREPRSEGLRKTMRRLLFVGAAGIVPAYLLILWSRPSPDWWMYENLADQYVLMVLMLAAVTLVVAWPGQASTRAIQAGLVGILAFDLLLGSYPVWEDSTNPDRRPPHERAWVDALKEVDEPLRLVRGGHIHPRTIYRHGWGVVDGESTLAPAAFLDLYAASKTNPRLLDLLNVRFFVLTEDGSLAPRMARAMLWPGGVHRLPRPPGGDVRWIELETQLQNAADVPQGEAVATLHAMGADGTTVALPIRAGIETAEWALDRPGLHVAHAKPPIARSWPATGGYDGHTYRARLKLPAGLRPTHLVIERPRGRGLLVVERAAADGQPLAPEPLRWIRPGLFENVAALPRAFLVRRARVVPPDQMPEQLHGLDPTEEVLVTDAPPPDWRPGGGLLGSPLPSVRVIEYRPERVRLETETPEPAVLVLSDTYDRNWRAWRNGEQATIVRANHALRAVFLGPGRHQLEFRYCQPLVWVGLTITLATVVILAVAGVITLIRSRPPRTPRWHTGPNDDRFSARIPRHEAGRRRRRPLLVTPAPRNRGLDQASQRRLTARPSPRASREPGKRSRGTRSGSTEMVTRRRPGRVGIGTISSSQVSGGSAKSSSPASS